MPANSRHPSEAILPSSARRLIVALLVLAATMIVVALGLTRLAPTLLGVGVVAVGIAAAEALQVEVQLRRGGVIAVGLSEAVLTAGLLLFTAPDVIVGVAIGLLAWQAHERIPIVKFAANLGMFVASTVGAAMAVHIIAGPAPGLSGIGVAGVAVGVLIFLLVNTLTLSIVIAQASQGEWPQVLRRMMPSAAVIPAASACMGVLAVALLGTHPWAVPVLLVPVAILHWGARLDIRAREERERSATFVETEQALGDATSPQQVMNVLATGVQRILGCRGAVWRDDQWVTPVPAGSGPCPVDQNLGAILVAGGPALGPAVEGRCAAVGLGGGVLVAWSGELDLDRQSEDWLEKLGRSGRVHLDRAVANAALEQERATLRSVVDGTVDGIFVLDGDGVIRLWNPAMVALSGVPAGQAVGRAVTEVLAHGAWDVDGVHDVLRHGDQVWRVSLAHVHSDAAIFDPDGVGGADLRVGVVHDVSAERRAARMKDDMLAVVSHELRTPLTPIKASAQLLHRRWDRLPEHQRMELLGQIESRADHLARLVEDLLLVGQLSSEKDAQPPIRPQEIDLAGFISDCTAQLAAAHPLHPLECTVPDQLRVRTDPVRVRQILDNLVGNACKFSPAGAIVDISLREVSGGLELIVADGGRGIPAGDLRRVFERFERVEDPLHMTTSGAGLGLYIVRALARALGGDVTIDSTLGVGTTVTVRIAAERTAPAEPARARSRAPASP